MNLARQRALIGFSQAGQMHSCQVQRASARFSKGKRADALLFVLMNFESCTVWERDGVGTSGVRLAFALRRVCEKFG